MVEYDCEDSNDPISNYKQPRKEIHMKNYTRFLNTKKSIYAQDIHQEKELTDEELAMVVGGLNAQPLLPPEPRPNVGSNPISGNQLNKAGYGIGG
jgi:hypothetical protein